MRAYPIRQAEIDRTNLNLGLENPKPTVNISQRFIAFDDLIGCQIGGVGDLYKMCLLRIRCGRKQLSI
jgi:hypothetical protein